MSDQDHDGGLEKLLLGLSSSGNNSETTGNQQKKKSDTEEASQGNKKRSSPTSGGDDGIMEMNATSGAGGINDNTPPNSTRGSRESSDHEMHILTERERRKKMRTMFANLHALLPRLPPKVDKSSIVDEAVSYIKSLQQTLQKLQKQKLERLQQVQKAAAQNKPAAVASCSNSCREAFLTREGEAGHQTNCDGEGASAFPVQFQTWTSSNVVLNICGGGAQLSVCAPKKAGLFTAICCVLEKHNIEVVSAHVSSDASRCMYMIQAHHGSGVCSQLREAHDDEMEEEYKQAAREIMCWVTASS